MLNQNFMNFNFEGLQEAMIAGPADRLPGRLARPAAGSATLRVYKVILNQKSLRCNIDQVEEASVETKFDEVATMKSSTRTFSTSIFVFLPGRQPG